MRLIGISNERKKSPLAMSVLDAYIAANGLLLYPELSPALQAVAQASVLADQEDAFRRLVSAAREKRAAGSLHSRINDGQQFTRSVGSLGVLRRWQRDRVYLVKCIEGNLTYFYSDGRLHRFIPPS